MPKRNQRKKTTNPWNALLGAAPPAYKGEQVQTMDLAFWQAPLSTVVTTGLIANVTGISPGLLTNVSTRYVDIFDEYRVISCDVELIPLSQSAGYSAVWFDENSNATPTLAEAQERKGVRVPHNNGSVKAFTRHHWKARDIDDLAYRPTTALVPSVYFKVYTDATNFAAPITVTALWAVQGVMKIQFRGLKAV